MLIATIPQKIRTRPHTLLFLILCLAALLLLSACSDVPDIGTTGTPASGTTPTAVVSSPIPVSAQPTIVVNVANASKLTFTGTDTQNITSDTLALPYQKDGSTVTITLNQTITQDAEIKIPRDANLTVSLESGNIIVDTIQGQTSISLTNGTIALKNFTPVGTSTLKTTSGTISVTFASKAACHIQAQTNFGAVTSSYKAVAEQRDGMKAQASGSIGDSPDANVNLTVTSGSITLGSA